MSEQNSAYISDPISEALGDSCGIQSFECCISVDGDEKIYAFEVECPEDMHVDDSWGKSEILAYLADEYGDYELDFLERTDR